MEGVDGAEPRVQVSISLLKDKPQTGVGSQEWEPPAERLSRDYWFLLFESKTEIDPARYQEAYVRWNPGHPAPPIDQVPMFVGEVLCSEHQKLIGDLVLASNIAKPGSLSPDASLEFIDERFVRREGGYLSSLYWAWEAALELGWPNLLEMKLPIVWDWLTGLPGFDDGLPQGTAGRAVAALSYLLDKNSGGSSAIALMWAMVGLEALYVEGKMGLSHQLLSRCRVFLGEVTANRRKFNKLYDFRSRFVHGDIDFPLEYTSLEMDPKHNRFVDEAYSFEQMAAAMLLGTLQRMVQSKLYTLRFEYHLVTGANT